MVRVCHARRFYLKAAALLLPLVGTPAAAETPIAMELALVPASDAEPGGPLHDFRIGVYEVTHAQFAAFLNDALLNLDNERGQYLYLDTDSGDVFLHSDLSGVKGTEGSGTLVLDASITGGLTYDSLTDSYLIGVGFDTHPIAGVSWYGALKFCNWLTLNQGLDASQRAYQEAPNTNLGGWHPVVISDADWAIRDLDDVERAEWISQYGGFRLLMDDGATTESLYNEWYKAASWIPDETRHAIYGFGRDVITMGDANYFCSGDEYESSGDCADGGSTDAGYYDGSLRDPDGVALQTINTSNAYGLYDVSGNVWEWLTDQRSSPSFRSVRGGSWNSSTTSLKTTAIASSTPAFIQSQGTYGFRVAQSVLNTVTIEPEDVIASSGPFGGPYAPTEQVYTITNLTGSTLFVDITPDVPWLLVDGLPVLTDFSVAAYSAEAVTVSWDSDCTSQEPPLGTSTGAISFIADGPIPVEVTREVDITVTEPLSLSPTPSTPFEVEGFFDGPFSTTQVNTLTSVSESDISWDATSDQEWLLIDGVVAVGGTLDPDLGNVDDIVLSIRTSAESFDVGSYTATVSVVDECTQTEFLRDVELTIKAPIEVDPAEAIDISGVSGGPFEPASVELTLSNVADRSVTWVVDSDVTWLLVNGAASDSGQLEVGAAEGLTLTTEASTLPVGDHPATVSIRDESDPDHIFEMVLLVTLHVTELDVQPVEDWVAAGPVGGPFTPVSQNFILTNHGAEYFDWVAFSDVCWLDLNGESSASGTIDDPEAWAEVFAEINSEASLLEAGVHVATITFENQPEAKSTRKVMLEVGSNDFSVPTVLVPAEADQSGGPTYTYRVGQYEITNHEFAAFLNNSIYSLTDPRGHYMYHDTDSGDVYIAGSETGVLGTAGSGTLLFSAAVNSDITYDGEGYIVGDGAESLPVSGVSWYGAVKFCNWLTLVQGMAEDERVYHEGPTPADWFPQTIGAEIGGTQAATYAARDLNDSEREELVTDYAGFRLPMDGGVAASGPYNEWYKAAAMGSDGGATKVYGFGRDVLDSADANYAGSGDPYEPDATPLGYYDGTNQGGSFQTADSDNLFGLYDLCGNVREWVQDHGALTSERGLRGGHFQNAKDSVSLRNDQRSSRLAGDVQLISGFRVAQSVVGSPLLVEAPDPMAFTGPFGGAFEPGEYVLSITNPGAMTRSWTVSADQSWLSVGESGATSGSLAPNETIDVAINLSESANTVVPLAQDNDDLILIPASDEEPGGPDYSYWISRYEITNAEYVTFLNDALANLANERGAYLFVDAVSGSVYLHDDATGIIDASGEVDGKTVLFDLAAGSDVTFDGVDYDIIEGLENHPVSGVTWFGAVKYCNWRTLDEGFATGQRCYAEGPYPGDWHPVTIATADWWGTDDTAANPSPMSGARDLNDAERLILADLYSGFRLPMDGGATEASAFNEWYKAAAWRSQPAASGTDGSPAGARGSGVHHVYGFGRDVLSGGDANYLASGDPWDDGKSPVGTFSGQLYDDVFQTVADQNSYGLFDTCGNVAEWVQDRGSNSTHVTRGGSWASLSTDITLRADDRRDQAAGTAVSSIGFRIVQSRRAQDAVVTLTDLTTEETFEAAVSLIVEEPLAVTPIYGLQLSAKYGEDLSAAEVVYQLQNLSAAELPWLAETSFDWVSIEPADGDLSDVPPEGARVVTVGINGEASSLPPGDHTAIVSFTDVFTGYVTEREIAVSISPSLEMTPSDSLAISGYWGGPFTPAEFEYSLLNTAAQEIEYELSADVEWLALSNSDGAAAGTLAVDESETISVAVLDEANSLQVGNYSAVLPVTDANSGYSLIQNATLDVLDPLDVLSDDLQSSGPFGGPLSPAEFQVTLTNKALFALDWEAESDTSWLLVNGSDYVSGSLEVGGVTELTLTLSEDATLLSEGEHTATVSLLDYQSGYTQTLEVSVTIDEGLSITPSEGVDFYAPVGGASDPAYAVFWMTNLETTSIDYELTSDQPWILLSGSESLTGALDVDQTQNVVVTLDEAQTALLPSGDYTATLSFTNLSTGFGSATRTISLHLVTPSLTLDLPQVPAANAQPSGPSYDFLIGRYEVTKSQFVVFLNNALSNLANERGQYLYFDTDSGDVFIHNEQTGTTGTSGSGTYIFDLSVDGRIVFDGSLYSVTSGYEDHPAVGMSWYGALKFCNWLTLDQGLSPQQRCYLEGPVAEVLTAWRPASLDAAEWAAGDLDDTERAALVVGYGGFRLPMDDGSANSDPAKDSADGYNEWYKAAAWNAGLLKNTIYGFGRDTFTSADANYLASGDPFESGATPAGYYDGTDHGGVFPTNDTANTAGLYDMSGNVAEWVQDRYVGTATTSIRGGSFAVSLKDVNVRAANFPGSPNYTVGMRVLRVPTTIAGDGDVDGDVDLLDLGQMQSCFTGPDVQGLSSACVPYDTDNDSDVDLVDFSQFQSQFSGPGT